MASNYAVRLEDAQKNIIHLHTNSKVVWMADGSDLESAMAQRVELIVPEKIPLTLGSGCVHNRETYYTVDQFGHVFIELNMKHTSGFTHGQVVAYLPENIAGHYCAYVGVIQGSGTTTRDQVLLNLVPDGTITILSLGGRTISTSHDLLTGSFTFDL